MITEPQRVVSPIHDTTLWLIIYFDSLCTKISVKGECITIDNGRPSRYTEDQTPKERVSRNITGSYHRPCVIHDIFINDLNISIGPNNKTYS